MDTFESVGDFGEPPNGGSGALDEGGFPSTGGTLGSEGGSPLPADSAGSAGAIAGDCVGLEPSGPFVFAGEAAGLLGRDAGLAASIEGVACFRTVVGLQAWAQASN